MLIGSWASELEVCWSLSFLCNVFMTLLWSVLDSVWELREEPRKCTTGRLTFIQ